ncbi:sigma-54 dependent transcriptional regulator [Rubrivirga sp. S365]|uniref:Sigma-54 dependent transcriptional regulator n=1 Tax=Rubrivirga litoralis TaxID=3075598 RepID=A0ABU3BTD0_9BACT|nr:MULTISPECIES: sigma-54 dependent transcriptional regulator [unclassified Rubrivirga]MDT0632548.1 sigma-54 dependent transcriptional regulator [Rubrivirga sp. F394]MDT7856766.1 sigma-54 dependent transcriptional regulator [Rubrivirga sp. S365]
MLPPSAAAPPPDASVLVVDDNEDVLTAIRLLLRDHVQTVHTATSPAALPTLLRETRYDCVLLDMNFSRDASTGREGLRWLENAHAIDPGAVVVMITGYGDVDLAVRAMKHGAADFVTKPWANARLLAAVGAAAQLRRQREASGAVAGPAPPASGPPRPAVPEGGVGELVGQSPAMRAVYETVRKVAPTDANVLILGENGTGKELVAEAVHRLSGRAAGPFVSVDLGAVPPSLFESELFGHAKGAFTGAAAGRAGRFEAAAGGTLFLDEIGNAGPTEQAKLLAALQRREVVRVGESAPRRVDVRVVSATNVPVYERVAEGAFRQDLLYRINTVELRLPPLRERGADLDLLADHFLARYAGAYGRAAAGFTDGARARLRQYGWPGNVRELQHTVERAVILAEGDRIADADLQFSAAPPSGDAGGQGGAALDTLDLEELERAAVRRALAKHGGNITHAADELGLTRKSLYRRIEKYGL